MSTAANILIVVLGLPVVVALVTIAVNHRITVLDRRRDIFANAYTAYCAYKEFPYVVLRRGSESQAERLRISEDLRQVQQQLAFHNAWLQTESRPVAAAYAHLLDRMKEVAGTAIHVAWTTPPTTSDSQMNIEGLADELCTLRDAEQLYLDAVRGEVGFWGAMGGRRKAHALGCAASLTGATKQTSGLAS